MKLRIRALSKPRSIEEHHAHKKNKFLLRIRKRSNSIRKRQLSDQREQQANEIKQAHLANGTGPVNKSGNKRGLNHLALSSDEMSEKMRRARAMRRFFNKQMPVPQCNGCAFSSQCPQFKGGYECAFLPFLNSHKVESVEDLVDYMKQMVESGARRTMWALTAETLTGGRPSFETTEQMQLLFTQLKDLYELVTKQDTEIEIEGEASIIGQIFGGIGNLLEETKEAHEKPIDITPIAREITQDEGIPLLMDNTTPADVDVDLITEFAKGEIIRKTSGKSEIPMITVSEARK